MEIHFSNIIVLLKLFLISFTAADGPGWLQICSNSQKLKIEAGGCPRGVWLKSPIQVNCVCVNGIWALSKSACDDSPFLLVGRGLDNCFSINAEIDSFKYIGRPSDPFASASYLGTSFLGVFWQMPTGKGSNDHQGLNSSVAMISVNSDSVVESRGQLCCRKGLGSTGHNMPVAICLADRGKTYKAQDFCSTGTRQVPYNFELSYGQGVQLIKEDVDQYMAWDKSIILESTDQCMATCGQSQKPDMTTDCCKSLDFEDVDEEAAVDLRQIDAQTGRIASQFLQLKLWRKHGHRIEHPEYDYLKAAKKILAKLCPNDNISTFVLNGVMHLFHFLLVETMDRFPFIKRFEAKRHDRILKALETCLSTAKSDTPMTLEWSSTNQCPPQIDGVSVTPPGNQSQRYSTSEMPRNQTFDHLRYDFPLESIWKIMSFTHYYCAKHFSEYPSDHSQLLITLESFYNPELLQRWANPGKSYKVFERIFNMYQLPRFVVALDACVTGAKLTSDYKQWIMRPLLRRFGPQPGQMNQAPVFGDTGYCLASYWDPETKPEGSSMLKIHPKTQASCFPPNNQFYQV